MSEIKKITIIGEFKFPRGSAASTRVLGIGKMLRDSGYEVSFIGKVWKRDKPNSTAGTFDCFNFSNLIVHEYHSFRRVLEFLMSGYDALKILKREFSKADLIIYYGDSLRYLLPLLKYRRREDKKLIVDCVEWHDATHAIGGRFGPVALDTNISITKIIPKCDGVIAISSFLHNYYTSHGVKSIRIPQIVDMAETKWDINLYKICPFDQRSLNLIYAGTPGKKDLLIVAIQGIHRLLNEGFKINLHLFGPSSSELASLLGGNVGLIETLHESLIFHGKILQDDIPKNIAKGDFSILIRPNKRYSNAGFATKFVESYAAGVPVIANLTSDMGLYLKDTENGFVMEDCSVESFIDAVIKATRISKQKRIEMKVASKKEAMESFDYRNYVGIIDDFIKSI